jgi:diguanylate cyclase
MSSNRLKEVTYKTLKTLKNFDIVLPSDYSKVFELEALEAGLDIKDEKLVLEYMSQDIDRMDGIFNQTNESLSSLKNSTIQAFNAIEQNDKDILSKIKMDIVSLQNKVQFLQKELFTDSLTHAYNRKWFNDTFLQEDSFISDGIIGFLDLNNFKAINDNYGHIVGDMVLKYLVDFLIKNIHEKDFYVVRYAGDEFLTIFKDNYTLEYINKILKNLQKNLFSKKLVPKHNKEVSFSFTFSYGIAKFKTNDNIESILQIIDDKMYENKNDFKKS